VSYDCLSAFTNQKFCFLRNRHTRWWSSCSFVGTPSLDVSPVYTAVFQRQHWLLACTITSPFELRSGPSACWPGGRLTSRGKEHHFTRLQCWEIVNTLYTLSFLICDIIRIWGQKAVLS